MTKKNLNKLLKIQGAMERPMLHITLKYKNPNTWIRATTKVRDVREKVTRLKLQYAGHYQRWQLESWDCRLSHSSEEASVVNHKLEELMTSRDTLD